MVRSIPLRKPRELVLVAKKGSSLKERVSYLLRFPRGMHLHMTVKNRGCNGDAVFSKRFINKLWAFYADDFELERSRNFVDLKRVSWVLVP